MPDEAGRGYCQLDVAPMMATIARLQEDRGYRDRRGLFFAEGVRNFVEAIDHRFPVEALIYSERLLINAVARKLLRRLKRAGVPFARASPEEFRSISRTERASGVGGIFRQRLLNLRQLAPAGHEVWIAVGHVRSPGNLGTLMRTSAATGGAGFILLSDAIDPFDPTVVRATMGAVFRQKLVRTSTDQFRLWLNSNKLQVIGASPNGAVDYDRVHYVRPAVLVLGGERSGLTDEQRSFCQQIVRIPMAAGTDSLNLAVAGSILMYELFRSSRLCPKSRE